MTDSTNLDLTDQEMDDYLDVVYFAISKGTANVSPSDKKKLRPLLRHYAKMKHPFTACVRDNRKRFGAHTEEYCAVLKDLIVGNTKWRGKGKKYTPKNLSESFTDFNVFLTDVLEFENEVPEDFLGYLDQLTDEDIESITGESIIAENAEFAEGDVVWDYSKSMDHIRREVEGALNEANTNDYVSGEDVVGMQYWVEDIQPGQALVCHNYNEYYVVPFKMNKNGVVLSDEADWTPVAKAWVEQNYAEEPQILAEMFFGDEDAAEEDDGVIWKTIMREGTWKYSPGPGQRPVAKPITVVKDGTSDARKFTISLEELKKNFEAGAKDHVTIPTSHDDKVYENTGFIDRLKIDVDSKGRAVLKAAHRFTDKKIKQKVLDGSIANVSAGILFDYIKKDTGTKFNAILGHSALTNSPWLNDMEGWETLAAGENLEVISFSEEDEMGNTSNTDNATAQNERGGVIVSTQTETPEVNDVVLEKFGFSEEQVKERLERLEAVEAEVRKNRIDAKLAAWKEEGKSPAVLTVAEQALLADSGTYSINFSENGKSSELSLSEVVERLVAASPELKLDEEVVNEENLAGTKPPEDASEENVDFSEEEKTEIAALMFDHGQSEAEAIEKVRSARDSA
jgi:hypothetical protein